MVEDRLQIEASVFGLSEVVPTAPFREKRCEARVSEREVLAEAGTGRGSVKRSRVLKACEMMAQTRSPAIAQWRIHSQMIHSIFTGKPKCRIDFSYLGSRSASALGCLSLRNAHLRDSVAFLH